MELKEKKMTLKEIVSDAALMGLAVLVPPVGLYAISTRAKPGGSLGLAMVGLGVSAAASTLFIDCADGRENISENPEIVCRMHPPNKPYAVATMVASPLLFSLSAEKIVKITEGEKSYQAFNNVGAPIELRNGKYLLNFGSNTSFRIDGGPYTTFAEEGNRERYDGVREIFKKNVERLNSKS